LSPPRHTEDRSAEALRYWSVSGAGAIPRFVASRSNRMVAKRGVVTAHRRRARRSSAILLIAATMTTAAVGQTGEKRTSGAEETWSAACSSKIQPPTYPRRAVAQKLTGSVTADFTIDSGGKALTLVLQGPVALAEAARNSIGNTTFPSPCSGRPIEVTFSFQMKNDLSAQYYISACFAHPPNEFWVRADAIRMVCSHYSYMSALTGPGGVKPVTVCEVLSNPVAYDGKDIALLGRFDHSPDGNWLSEETCPSALIVDGYTWPNQVWIGGGESAPDPRFGLLVLDPIALSEKLESVRRTTHLRLEETGTSSGPRMVSQSWEVMFGRIEARERLRPPEGAFPRRDWGNGFGLMNTAPVQIIGKPENTFLIPEETATPK
jgi:Gram-negative bacterial TonB protein C-terminal